MNALDELEEIKELVNTDKKFKYKNIVNFNYDNIKEELNYASKCHNLEEEIGCPLEVVFKALGHWIYDEEGNAWYIEHYYQEHNVYQLHSVRNFGRIADKKFNTKDYKKTWFLKKDKSE